MAAFALLQHFGDILTFGVHLLAFLYVVHQTRHLVVHRKIFHWHPLQGGDQLYVQLRQALEQGYNNDFDSHGWY